MCVTDRHDTTLSIKVALNTNTTNRSNLASEDMYVSPTDNLQSIKSSAKKKEMEKKCYRLPSSAAMKGGCLVRWAMAQPCLLAEPIVAIVFIDLPQCE